ncbi:MAG TPA: prenyltransferase/squalene oxidase repeat-containing protein [Candidatus Sulfotelmatobacter sp.]|nr:prenyltransferase/squalene oxidase repeat-containing protein [Candidatus Sulfotelmatobacter sp.]
MTASAERALADGTRFLLEMQAPAGCWRDFEVDRADESDAWVTGYVGTALAAVAAATGWDLGGAVAAARAFLLCAAAERPGWGFNGDAPPDADSTAWATLMLAASGGAPALAYGALRTHRRPDGGFSTYVRFSDPSMWEQSQADVSAAALQALAQERGADRADLAATGDYLRAAQRPDGSWPSYWYATPLYALVHALHALAASDASAAGAPAAAALSFARAQGVPDDDAFALALLAELEACFGDGRAGQLRDALIALQRADGRWTAGRPFMRPDPWKYAPGDPDAAIVDKYGLFTTATVLRALCRA